MKVERLVPLEAHARLPRAVVPEPDPDTSLALDTVSNGPPAALDAGRASSWRLDAHEAFILQALAARGASSADLDRVEAALADAPDATAYAARLRQIRSEAWGDAPSLPVPHGDAGWGAAGVRALGLMLHAALGAAASQTLSRSTGGASDMVLTAQAMGTGIGRGQPWQIAQALAPLCLRWLGSLRCAGSVDQLVRGVFSDPERAELAGVAQAVLEADQQLLPPVLADLDPRTATLVFLALTQVSQALLARLPAASAVADGMAQRLAELPVYWQRLVGITNAGVTLLREPPRTEQPLGLTHAPTARQHAVQVAGTSSRIRDGVAYRFQPGRTVLHMSGPARGSWAGVPEAAADPVTPAQTVLATLQALDALHAEVCPAEGIAQQLASVDNLQRVDGGSVCPTTGDPAPARSSAGASRPLLPVLATGATGAGVLYAGGSIAPALIPPVIGGGIVAAVLYGLNKAYGWLTAGPSEVSTETGTTPTPAPTSSSESMSNGAHIARLEKQLVLLGDGSIATGWDILEGRVKPRQVRRALATAAAVDGDALYPAVTPEDARQVATVLTPVEVGQLKSSPEALLQQSEDYVLQAKAVAWGQQPGWEWLGGLTPSEQRIAVRAIEQERRLHQSLQASTDQRLQLNAAIRAAGGACSIEDLVVPGTAVGGSAIPLLAYLLYRTPGQGKTPLTMADGTALTPTNTAALETVLAGTLVAQLQRNQPLTPNQRAQVEAMTRARFTWGLMRAKAQGTLSGPGQWLHGAAIALNFLNGTPGTSWSTVTFTGLDTHIALPNTLVIRDDHDQQVVVYRADANSVVAARDEADFMQSVGAGRAAQDLAIKEGFRADVIAAASPEQQQELISLYYDQQYSGTPQRRPEAWNRETHIRLDFSTPQHNGTSGLDAWVDNLARWRDTRQQVLAQRQATQGRQHWSPEGSAAVAAALDAKVGVARLQTYEQHALPHVNAMLAALPGLPNGLVRQDGQVIQRPAAADIDLRIGGRTGDLPYWATWGWQQPDRQAMGSNWVAANTNALSFQAWTTAPNGSRVQDPAWTTYFNAASFKAVFYEGMTRLVGSGRLSTYGDYLDTFRRSADFQTLRTAMAANIQSRLASLVQAGCQSGQLPAADCSALRNAVRQLDASPSQLLSVSLNGSPVDGLFAVQAGSDHFIAVLEGPHGDVLLPAAGFKAFLAKDKHQAETYIAQRAGYRYHANLAKAFQQPGAIRLGYAATGGTQAAAGNYLDKLIDNTAALNGQARQEASTFMKTGGGLLVAAACMAGLAPLCGIGAAALLGSALEEGMDRAERGDVDGALEAFGEALENALDLPGAGRAARLLFKVGQKTFSSVGQASGALAQLARQNAAFNADGTLKGTLAWPPVTTGGTRGPYANGMLVTRDGMDYVRTGENGFRRSYVDDDGVRRLADGDDAPIRFRQGGWQAMDDLPGAETLAERTREAVPEARWLSDAELDTLLPAGALATFSTLAEETLAQIRHAGVRARAGQLALSAEQIPTAPTTQGNGVWDAGGNQYIQLEGYWLRSKEHRGQRYVTTPAGVADRQFQVRRDGLQWQVVPPGGLRGGGKLGQLFGPRYRDARTRLDGDIADVGRFKAVWDIEKKPAAQRTPAQRHTLDANRDYIEAEKQRFATELETLVNASNADAHPQITQYSEAESDLINIPLRAGTSTPDVAAFLDAFGQLNAYDGWAYRAAQVTPQGATGLEQGVGKTFRDAGVQSASTQFINAVDWAETWAPGVAPAAASRKVVFLFDPTVGKKNLAGPLLKDHVAVVPGALTKVLAVKTVDGVLYVAMGSSARMPDQVFDPYTGAQVL